MKVLLIVLLTSSVSRAEFANGVSAGIFAKNKGDATAVQYNQGNDKNGREYKAGDASTQGNAGQVMAWVTGGALTAAGSALIMSPFIWDQIAGADLLAKGAMEFAQAGADAASSNDNSSQRNLLTQGETTTFDRAPKQIHNPELDKMLSQRGIDPYEFKQRMISGGFTSRDQIMEALGMDKNFNSDDAERGTRLANSKFASLLGHSMGAEAGHDSSANLSETSRFDEGSSGTRLSFPQSATEAVASAAPSVQQSIGAKEHGEENLVSTDFPMPNLRGFLNSMMQGTGTTLRRPSVNVQMSRSELESLGIKKAQKKQSIFDISQKTYRNFSRWRKGSGRVASN